MYRVLQKIGYGAGLVVVLCGLNVGSVSAGNVLCPENAPPAVKNSEVCTGGGDKISGPGGVINDVTEIVSVVAGIAAVIMIMYGGFKYITSAGEASKVSEAKNILIYSVIGLIVIIVARAIILFVIVRL